MAQAKSAVGPRRRRPLWLAVGLVWLTVVVLAVLAWLLVPLVDPVPAPTPDQPTSAPPSPTPEATPSPLSYSVSLDPVRAGATVKPAVISAELGQPVARLPYAQLEGQRFLGWFTDPDDPAAPRLDNATLDQLPTDRSTTLYARFEPKPTTIDRQSDGLPILMYHYFYDPDRGESGADGNWLDIRLFRQQLTWLRDNNYYYPTWDEADAYLRGDIVLPSRSIILTSDDALPSVYELAVPAVLDYGAKLTIFPVVKYFDPAWLGQFDPERIFFQSHSYDMHPGTADGSAKLLTATPQEIAADVAASAAVLGTKDILCYPYGVTTEVAEAALAANGVRLALIIGNQRAYPLMDPMAIPRLRMSDGLALDDFIYIVRDAY
ncbi:MAG: hypothetical protein LBK42_05955 [Propionibacteriaceae bacterium]|jgi:hypothetical protein|nr:hypothetical protein [Propionibacteriaceae bacterium]